MNSQEVQSGINHIYKNDKNLAKIIDLSGKCPLKPKKNHYLTLLGSIIGQQLSIKAAASIEKKFLDYFNSNPVPEKILSASDLELRSLGLSNAKVKYVKDLSQKIIDNEVSFKGISKMSNDEIITHFTKVKGIGVWTVHMFLIFTLARPDVLPIGDLGIKKGAMKVYKLKELPDEKKLVQLSKKHNWAPYSTIASWYLWKSLEI